MQTLRNGIAVVAARHNKVGPDQYTKSPKNSHVTSSPESRTLSRVSDTTQTSSSKLERSQTSNNVVAKRQVSSASSKSKENQGIPADVKSAESSGTNSKVILVAVILGIVIASGGLAIGIFLVVRPTQTTSVSNTTASTSNQLRWNPVGITVAGNGFAGSASNQLYWPRRVALDASDTLYITDQYSRVQKWVVGRAAGTTVAGQANGIAGSSPMHLNLAWGVFVDTSNNLYMADTSNHRVQLWSNGTTFGRTVAGNGSNGTAYHQLFNPRGVMVDTSTGTIYVADTDNHRIMSYAINATNGTLVAGGNGGGSLSTQLYQPYALYFDSSTNSLIIINYYIHTIVRWFIGASGWTLIAGSVNVYGVTPLTLTNPLDVTLDWMGNMYIADSANHRIQFFPSGQANGTTIAGIGGVTGNAANVLNSPSGIALDRQFNLYVADTNNHRVQMFLRY